MKSLTHLATPATEIDKQRRAVRTQPRNARAHAMLGMALQQAGQLGEAVESLRQALALDPRLSELHALMAAALRAMGRHDEAADSYRRALLVQPENADLHHGLSDCLLRLNRIDAAEDSARNGLASCPDHPDLQLIMAGVRYARGDYEGAATAFRRALALRPNQLAPMTDLADVLFKLRQFDEAAAVWRATLKIAPDSFNSHFNLAENLRELDQLDDALRHYRRALELRPDDPSASYGLGVTLHLRGDVEDALAALTRQHELQPDAVSNLSYMAYLQMELGQLEQAIQIYRRVLELQPQAAAMHSNLVFALSHHCNDPEELFAAHRAYGDLVEAPFRDRWPHHPNERTPTRRLRVGFVSSDLYRHAVANFIEPVFAVLKDSPQLELHAYYNNRIDDWMHQRIRKHIAHWHSIVDLDDDAVEMQIRADGIDILVDLSGHSAGNRLPLFARKPAPVQVSWIGYAGTTGLRAMDYYLGDQFYLPEGRHDAEFTENIVRLPLSAPFMPSPEAPPIGPLPALTNGYLTFGSFHRINKLSRQVIAHWCLLLRALPDSRMLLGNMHAGARETVQAWFVAEGIDPARLTFHDRTNMNEYLALHDEIDICLSPFPYSGGTTLAHALWMGVPTLSTVGATNPSHAVACYLAHLGLVSFIAEDDQTFVQLGIFLSQNLHQLAALRASMRDRFNASVIGYPGVAAAGLEHAFRSMWQRWCAGQPPAPLRVRLADLIPRSDDGQAP